MKGTLYGMNYKSIDNYGAFQALEESIKETDSNDVEIAKIQKELYRLQNKKEQDVRKEHILAANYFTKEIICDIYKRTQEILKCNDFDLNEYIQVFADSSKIDREHIIFLVDRLTLLAETEEEFSNVDADKQNHKKNFLDTLSDILFGGGANGN